MLSERVFVMASLLSFVFIGDLFHTYARSVVSMDSFFVDVLRLLLSLQKVTDFLIFNLMFFIDSEFGLSWFKRIS